MFSKATCKQAYAVLRFKIERRRNIAKYTYSGKIRFEPLVLSMASSTYLIYTLAVSYKTSPCIGRNSKLASLSGVTNSERLLTNYAFLDFGHAVPRQLAQDNTNGLVVVVQQSGNLASAQSLIPQRIHAYLV